MRVKVILKNSRIYETILNMVEVEETISSRGFETENNLDKIIYFFGCSTWVRLAEDIAIKTSEISAIEFI